MIADNSGYSFGPVPSRRLGRSLGINNIPAKVCSYSCIYCQVGRTPKMQAERQVFHRPLDIFRDVKKRLETAKRLGDQADYLTFVPDGEPTLDVHLGKEIRLLRALEIPIAIITNSSHLWRDDVREEVARADWVSLKIDSIQELTWRRINRPHRDLKMSAVLDGISEFARFFTGKLVTETMLVKGFNDCEKCTKELADFIYQLKPAAAYLSIPIRPPAEKWAECPDEDVLARIYHCFTARAENVEYLIGYEGDAFSTTGDVEKDLLSITAVHPLRKEAVCHLLSAGGASWTVVDRMIEEGNLIATNYNGHTFYVRKLPKARRESQ